MGLDQIGIMVFGAAAIWLVQYEDARRRRWAYVAGLLGQPFWYWTTYANEQWGIFAMSVLYSISWALGFRRHWLKKEE